MPSNAFSRRPRIQQPPKVCKSKKPPPTATPICPCSGRCGNLRVNVVGDPGRGEYADITGEWLYLGRSEDPHVKAWVWVRSLDQTDRYIMITYYCGPPGDWDPPDLGNLWCQAGSLHGNFAELTTTLMDEWWPDPGDPESPATIFCQILAP